MDIYFTATRGVSLIGLTVLKKTSELCLKIATCGLVVLGITMRVGLPRELRFLPTSFPYIKNKSDIWII